MKRGPKSAAGDLSHNGHKWVHRHANYNTGKASRGVWHKVTQQHHPSSLHDDWRDIHHKFLQGQLQNKPDTEPYVRALKEKFADVDIGGFQEINNLLNLEGFGPEPWHKGLIPPELRDKLKKKQITLLNNVLKDSGVRDIIRPLTVSEALTHTNVAGMNIRVVDNHMTITIPLEKEGRLSSSGKSYVHYSSRGFRPVLDGLKVNINVISKIKT